MREYHELEAEICEISETFNTLLVTRRLDWTLVAEGSTSMPRLPAEKLVLMEGFGGGTTHEGHTKFYFKVDHPYGDTFVGFWFCPTCKTERFPRQLREENLDYPYGCPECGEAMQYDEKA